jgi:hypothetical protein
MCRDPLQGHRGGSSSRWLTPGAATRLITVSDWEHYGYAACLAAVMAPWIGGTASARV